MNEITPQLKKIFEKAQGVRLSDSEKKSMRASLQAHMQAEALRPKSSIPSPWVMGRFVVFIHKPVAVVLIAFLVLSGTTAYAAEGALPGDALYTVKVDVVEEVRAALTVTDKEKMRWDAQRAERRLEEAATLAAAGRLTDEVEIEIEERFEKFAEKVEVRAQKAENSGNARAAAIVLAEFEGTLRGHAQVLAHADQDSSAVSMQMSLTAESDVAANSDAASTVEESAPDIIMMNLDMAIPTEEPPQAPLPTRMMAVGEEKREAKEAKKQDEDSRISKKVKQRLEKLERAREQAERKAQNKNGREKRAAEDRIEDAEEALERVEKAFQKKPQRIDVKVRIDDARERIEDARKSGATGSSSEAFIEAQAAVSSINESSVLLKVNGETIIDERTKDDHVELEVETKSEDGRSSIKIKSNIFNQKDD